MMIIFYRLAEVRAGQSTGGAHHLLQHRGTMTIADEFPGYTFDGSKQWLPLHREAQVKVLHSGGSVVAKEGSFIVEKADKVTLFLTAGTDFKQDRSANWRGVMPHAAIAARLEAATKKSYDELLSEHIRGVLPALRGVDPVHPRGPLRDFPARRRFHLRSSPCLWTGLPSVFNIWVPQRAPQLDNRSVRGNELVTHAEVVEIHEAAHGLRRIVE